MFLWKKKKENTPPANRLASLAQSTQQPQLVCTWSAHAPQSWQSPSPLPRHNHTLTMTTTAPGEIILFGGYPHGLASNDLYVISTRDFSATLLQTSGEVPTPRYAHVATLTSTSLLICGGMGYNYDDVLNYDSLYLLNLGTSDFLMSSLTQVDHSFALQYRESGPALWSMVLDHPLVASKPQPWSVPSSSSPVVKLGGRSSMTCGHSIWTVVRFACCCSKLFWPDFPAVKSQPFWESYEPTPGNEKPPSRSHHVSVAIENHIIMFVPLSSLHSSLVIILCRFGGWSGKYHLNDTWSFDTSTRKWTELQCVEAQLRKKVVGS